MHLPGPAAVLSRKQEESKECGLEDTRQPDPQEVSSTPLDEMQQGFAGVLVWETAMKGKHDERRNEEKKEEEKDEKEGDEEAEDLDWIGLNRIPEGTIQVSNISFLAFDHSATSKSKRYLRPAQQIRSRISC